MVLFIALIFLALKTQGQEERFIFKGQVLNADNNSVVAFASIVVVNENKGTASNENGRFTFEAQVGQQIKITSIGFHPHLFIITNDHKNADQVIPIKLLPKTYELDSVVVIQMRDNFYLKRPIWDTLQIQNPYLSNNPRDWGQINTLGNTDGSAGFTITGFLNSFDKDLKQKRYLQRFAEAERFRSDRKKEIEKRFNKALVKKITRIDDRVIDEFMEFCDFRDGVILRSTEYELTVLILEKYKAFLLR